MEPGQVWLNLIPIFNIVWQFITVSRVADSLRNEFYDRGWHERNEDYGRGIGTAYCVLNIISAIPYIGGIFALGALVCFIIYWVKIANYSGQLAARTGYHDDYDDYDDDDDRRDDHDDHRDHRDDPRDERRDRRDRSDDRGRELDDGHEDRPWERR